GGAGRAGSAREPDEEPDVIRHRAPAVDHPPRRQDRRPRARADRGGGETRRAARASQWHVRDAVRAAAPREPQRGTRAAHIAVITAGAARYAERRNVANIAGRAMSARGTGAGGGAPAQSNR